MFSFGGPSKLEATTQMQSNSIPYHISSPSSRLNGWTNGYSSPTSTHAPHAAGFASPALQFDGGVFGATGKPDHDAALDSVTALEKHFYQSFRTGEFSDVLLTVLFSNGQPAAFNLHSIVISRSNFLRDLIRSMTIPRITLDLTVPNSTTYSITPSSLNISLSYLYAPLYAKAYINVDNVQSIFASAIFLQIPALADITCEMMRGAISRLGVEAKSWEEWCGFLFGSMEANGPVANGETTLEESGPFGRWGTVLRTEFLDRLIIKFPEVLLDSTGEQGSVKGKNKITDTLEAIIPIFVSLPFEIFKQAFQAKSLPIHDDIDRFALGKKIVAARKKRAIALGGAVDEEHVVLAFGSAPGTSNVMLMRKLKRNLWKVNSSAP